MPSINIFKSSLSLMKHIIVFKHGEYGHESTVVRERKENTLYFVIPKRLILGSIRVRGSHKEGQHNLLKRARTSKGVAQKILVVVTIAI